MAKIIAIIGGIVGIAATILWLVAPSLGWWEIIFDPIIGNNVEYYLSPFGIFTYGDTTENWLGLFLVGGLIFLVGSILILVGAAKESTGIAVLSAIVMIAGIGLFCYALYSYEDLQDILEFMEFWGGEYTVFFGTYNFFGTWNWRLGNGFFIAVAGAIIGLIGSFMVKGR
jgi:hypothetical protein